MAIDGVAPRAKMNQQRSRRFRSAKDLAEATKSKRITPIDGSDAGAVDPYAGAFDSNCITPGTEFLLRISNCIRYFIRKKIKEDPLWRNLKVIFSGPEVPGEGEHKIMQFIRDMRNDPGYKPNTRHCMYGQDADLIMLGLVSHEPHFTLLREIIDLKQYFAVINKAKWRLITFAFFMTVFAVIVVLKITPTYQATATLLIEAQEAKAVSFEEVYGLDSSKKEYYLTRVQTILT